MDDILKPELIWIEGRSYRASDTHTEVSAFQERDLYENEISYNDDEMEKEDDDCEISKLEDNRYFTNFHIAKQYFGAIIGKKGGMIGRIQHNTRTEIKLPKMGQNQDIGIYGASPANIKTAKRRIDIIVMESRQKQKPTHFLSIPMNHPDIIERYETFKALVLKECTGKGIEESLFIRPQKLHITLGVTCLMDNVERLHASKLLTEARNTIIMPMMQDYLPLKIRLKGVSYMNDDPKEISVLYGCVQEEDAPAGLLQKICDSLVHYFHREGYMKKEYGRDNVKMHVTFLNSRYREEDVPQLKSKQEPRVTFDGSEILSKFADFDFGVTELTDIHLSQRKSMGSDGYYQSTCVISCNGNM